MDDLGNNVKLITLIHLRISDIRNGDEHFKRILLVNLSNTSFDFILNLPLPLFPVTCKSKFLLVTPHNIRSSTRSRLRQEVV